MTAMDSDKREAPWAPEEVAALNAWQADGRFHPYTCGDCGAALVATEAGWSCPTEGCTYAQAWAHRFSTKTPPPHPGAIYMGDHNWLIPMGSPEFGGAVPDLSELVRESREERADHVLAASGWDALAREVDDAGLYDATYTGDDDE